MSNEEFQDVMDGFEQIGNQIDDMTAATLQLQETVKTLEQYAALKQAAQQNTATSKKKGIYRPKKYGGNER